MKMMAALNKWKVPLFKFRECILFKAWCSCHIFWRQAVTNLPNLFRWCFFALQILESKSHCHPLKAGLFYESLANWPVLYRSLQRLIMAPDGGPRLGPQWSLELEKFLWCWKSLNRRYSRWTIMTSLYVVLDFCLKIHLNIQLCKNGYCCASFWL